MGVKKNLKIAWFLGKVNFMLRFFAFCEGPQFRCPLRLQQKMPLGQKIVAMACLEPEFPAHSGHVELNGTPVWTGVFPGCDMCARSQNFKGRVLRNEFLKKMLDDVVKTRLHATKVVLSTSSPQQAAVRLYEKARL